MIHLVARFKSGNSIDSILIGKHQFIFYVLNICAGIFSFFSSETLGSTKIIEASSSNLALALLKASGVALAAFIGFRSTVSTLLPSKDGQKIEIGPGQLFAALLENIERRIDQGRMVKVSKEIKSIVPLSSPRSVLNVVLPYCFDQAEKDAGDRTAITNSLEAIHTSIANISSNERCALMLNHLHKSFGLSVLKSAIELVDVKSDPHFSEVYGCSSSSNAYKDGIGQIDVLQLTSVELDTIIKELSASKNSSEDSKC